MIKKTFFSFLVVIFALVLVTFFLPSRWTVEESIEIHRPPETIYPYLANLKEWEKWAPWTNDDPSMTYRYQGVEGEAGYQQYWEGKTGKGILTLNQLMPNYYVQHHIERAQYKFDGALELLPRDGNTKVIWKCFGDSGTNPLSKSKQLALEPLIRADFQKGLAKLKALIEQTP